MTLFNDGCHRSADTDAIRTHYDRLQLMIVILIIEIHCFGILCTKLEGITDFNAFLEMDPAAADRADISLNDIGDITA